MYKLFALAAVVAVAVAVSASSAREDKVTSIEDIMTKAHGKGGYRAQIVKATKGKKFDGVKDEANNWVKLAVDLGKNKAPKGSADSWKKLTSKYEKDVKDLATAVKDGKADGVSSALGAIGKSCGACHKAHKP